MNVEIINTGTELLLGRVLNTHQQWLCRELSDRGYHVQRQVAIADSAEEICRATRESLARADVIIVTGGLGPTSDDLTRDRLAEMLQLPLEKNSEIADRIEKFFTQRKRAMPASTLVQAMVPRGAIVLDNDHGTAPGLAIRVEAGRFSDRAQGVWLILLPGPPRELRPMFLTRVAPLLDRECPTERFECLTIRTSGIGESLAEEAIAIHLQDLLQKGLSIGYCARVGEVDIRLTARGDGSEELVRRGEKIVSQHLEKYIFGRGDEGLEFSVVKTLAAQKKTLAIAESCTGGYLCHRLTNVPGASEILLGGCVTYSNAEKVRLLAVKEETLSRHGAVSEAVAREMCEGVREKSGADFGISITGIAGPGGGAPEKPVGTVFIGLSRAGEKALVMQHLNSFDRETFKFVTTQQALAMLRRQFSS